MKKLIKYLRKTIPHNSPLRLWYTRLLQVLALLRHKRVDISGITLIGVTGTDGKTTTVEMIAHILEVNNIPYISSSSLETKMSGKKLAESKRTTPSLSTLLNLLQKAKDNDIKVVVIEVSSHALAQWRVLGIKFDTTVLTNITHEHLNFHKTRARYAATKKLLFTKYLKEDGVAILNESDEYGEKWLNTLPRKTKAYKQPMAGVTLNGTEYVYDNTTYTLPVLGAYNASNALAAALAVSASTNINTTDALKSLETFNGIPGRMQLIDTKDNPAQAIIVDFALTKRAMAATLSTVKDIIKNNGKVVVVFGATGGQHDTSVRPGLCESVSTWADIAIVTDDEPYDGDPAEIRDELERLLKEADAKFNKNTKIYNIADRRKALRKALRLVGPNDALVVSGLGHYTSRTINGEEVPWNDTEVITEELQKL